MHVLVRNVLEEGDEVDLELEVTSRRPAELFVPLPFGLELVDGVASLADKSLLVAAGDDVAGEPRFAMLQTIREGALSRSSGSSRFVSRNGAR